MDPYAKANKSVLEALAAIGSGVVLEPVAGLAGLIGTMAPGQPGQGAQWVKKVQDLAYAPRDDAALRAIASAAEVPLRYYEAGTDWLGNTTTDATGSPVLGTMAKTAPDIIGAALGLQQAFKTGAKTAVKKVAPPDEVDASKRRFLKNAGIAGAGLAIGSKLPLGSLDNISRAAPAVQTAAKVVSRIPVKSSVYNLAQFFRANEGLAPYLKDKDLSRLQTDWDNGVYGEGLPQLSLPNGVSVQEVRNVYNDLGKYHPDVKTDNWMQDMTYKEHPLAYYGSPEQAVKEFNMSVKPEGYVDDGMSLDPMPWESRNPESIWVEIVSDMYDQGLVGPNNIESVTDDMIKRLPGLDPKIANSWKQLSSDPDIYDRLLGAVFSGENAAMSGLYF